MQPQTTNKQHLLIGLTGGIASGKSTVATMLRDAGLPVIDADAIAREVVAPGQPALQEIFDTFGHQLQQDDGQLNRKQLAQIIFHDPDARQKLNQITHPRVATRAQELVQSLFQQGHHTVIYEVPLLFENQLQRQLDATILVALPQAQQIQRLCLRDNLSPQDALARIHSQMPLDEKRQLATYTIENTKELQHLQSQVNALLHTLSKLSMPSELSPK